MIAVPKLPTLLAKAKREGWAEWIRTDADERSVLSGCYFDFEAADFVRRFFRCLCHSKGKKWAGKPFVLEPWQWENIVGPLFGWMGPDGNRRYRTAYIEQPKKTGKSELAAGIGLYLVVGDSEPGAEVYSCATKRDQAAIVHDEAVRMRKASRSLAKRLTLNKTTKTLADPATNSKYAALASDGIGSEGLNAHALIVDELHVWSDRSFWDALKYATIGRTQPVKFIITTAGVYDQTSIGWQEHEHAIRVRDGETEADDYLVYIRGADPDADWLDPKTHEMATPGYGTIINPDEMLKAAKDAANRPIDRNTFLRYRLNIWVDAVDSVIDSAAWDACKGVVDEDELVGRECFGGLDLASRKDIAAFVMVFPPTDDDPNWVVLPRLFVPGDNAAKRERDERVPYETWGHQGHLILTEGNRVDYECIRQQILDDGQRFGLRDIGADKWNLEYLRQRLPDVEVVEYGQNYKDMSAPTKELIDSLIPACEIRHNGNPAMKWMAGNLVLFTDGNENAMPNKKKSTGKIDGFVALIMAIGRAMLAMDDDFDASSAVFAV